MNRCSFFRSSTVSPENWALANYTLLVLASTFILLLIPSVAAESPAQGFAVSRQVVAARPTFTKNFHIVADLGELPTSEQGTVTLEILNSTSTPIPISEVTIGCRCASARVNAKKILPGQSIVLEVDLETQSKPLGKNSHVAHVVKFDSGVGPELDTEIVLRYSLRGVLAFSTTRVVWEMDRKKKHQTIHVPIAFSAPVIPHEIKFSFLPAREGLTANFGYINEQPIIAIEFEPDLIAESNWTTTLTAWTLISESEKRGSKRKIARTDGPKGTRIEDEVVISLCDVPEFEITPRTLQFRLVKDQWIATCLIRDRQATEGKSPANEDVLHLEATIGSHPLKIQLKRIGPGIRRGTIVTNEDYWKGFILLDFETLPDIHWHAVSDNGVHNVKSLIYLPSSLKSKVRSYLEKEK